MQIRFVAILLFVLSWFLVGCPGARPVDRATGEGILLLGNRNEPNRLDPQLTTAVSEFNILFALYEGLVAPHPETLAPVPGVAERWEVEDDGRFYRFFLREDARWSNGDTLTAQDFIASWERLLTPRLGAPYAAMLHAIEGAEAFHRGETTDFSTVGLYAAGPHELHVRLRAPVPFFLDLLKHPATFPVHLPSIRANGDPFDRDNRWAGVGRSVVNGPFKLLRWEPESVLEVTRNPFYWDAETVSLNGIRFFPIVDLGAEERAFQAGQLHITEALAPTRVAHYRRNAPELLRIDPYLGTYYFLFNTNRAPLDDLRVRRALSLAIDRRAITDQILGAGQTPAYSFTPRGLGDYEPPQMPPGDLAEARALLAQAGFPNGEGFPQMEFLFNTSESHQRIAEAVREMWRRGLGIDIRLRNVELQVYFSSRREGDFDIARAVWIGDYLDPHTFLSMWTSASGQNFSGWSDPAFDALIAASDEAGPDTRYALLAEAETLFLSEHVVAPLYHYVSVFLIRPEVRGWHPTLLNWHPFKHVSLEALD